MRFICLRRLLSILATLLLAPSIVSGQGNTDSETCWPSETALGFIYNKSVFTNTSDFTLADGITMSLNGSVIDIGGGAGTFNRYATVLTPHSFNKYTVTMDVKIINASTSTSYGLGLGLRSINALFPQDIFGWVNLSTVANPGQIKLRNTEGADISASGNAISWSLNDVIRQTFAMADTVITYTVQNITTGGAAVSLSVTYVNTLSPALTRPNTSNFTIYEIGGTFQMKALSVHVTDKTNTNIAVASDSKFAYYAGKWAFSWPELLNAAYPSATKFCGSGDEAAHAIQEVYNLSLLKPRYLIWEFGSNDLRESVPQSVLEHYADSIYHYFTARGTTVYFILIPEDSTAGGVGQKSFDMWYRTHYPSNYISAVWDSLSTNNIMKFAYLAEGSVHPNTAGHAKIAQALSVSGKLNVQGICGSCESAAAVAYTSNSQTGNQAHRGELGMQFIVNNPGGIIVKQLGAFDDGGNGITGLQSGGIRVAVFNRASHTIVPGLDVTISGTADAYTGNHRMKNITPVTLPPGDYVIVAKGYHAGERNGNVGNGGGPYPAGDDGGGAISFGNETSYGPDDPNGFNYPATAGNFGTTHQFLAGTLVFTTTIPCGLSNNANLSNLVISQGTLAPTFAPVTTSYSASVPNSIASIIITPTAADAGTSITVNGIPVISGTPSSTIPLNTGSNIITTVVTAQDETTTKTYTVNVTRLSGDICESAPAQAYASNTQTGNQSHRGELGMEFIVNNPNGIVIKQLGAFDDGGNGINGLQPGAGVRVAVFNKTTHTIVPGLDVTVSGLADAYTGNHRMKNISPVTLPPGTYVIVAKGYHSGEKNGNSFEGGGPYPDGDNGGGAITFGNETCYGPDNPSGFTYPSSSGNFGSAHIFLAGTFVFTTSLPCGASSNANLSNLLLSQGTLAPQFATATTSYSALVANSTTSITLTPTAADAGATITVNGIPVTSGTSSGLITLAEGSNNITVVVTAQDGITLKTYTVNVTRSAGGSCESSPAQAYVSNTQTGNQSHRGELGMEFIVNNSNGIIIKQLGAFDDGGNGINGLQPGAGVRVAIFNKTTHTIVPGLDVTISGAADAYTGNHRMKNISPVNLPPGTYVIVAKGFHLGEKNGNSFEGGGPYPVGNNGGGAITFSNETSFGPDNPSGFTYPATAGNFGNSPIFLAGTFSFTVNISCPPAVARVVTSSVTDTFNQQSKEPVPALIVTAKGVNIFPNPARGQFMLQLNGNVASKINIRIMNAYGRLVEQKTVGITNKNGSLLIPFNLSNQPAGIYLVKVESADFVQTGKIIILR